MRLTVASPMGGTTVDEVVSVQLHTVDGEMGVLGDHADLVALLPAGPVRYTADGAEHLAICGSGTVRIEGGNVHLAVEQWADSTPDTEVLGERLEALSEQLSDHSLAAPVRRRLRRELDFIESWMARGEQVGA